MIKSRELVVLLHGLFRTTASMRSVERYLLKHGYDVVNISYASTSANIAELSQIVSEKINQIPNVDSYEKMHFVTHSLGSIILRYMQQKSLVNVTGNSVMLTPPNHGAVVVDKLPKWKWLVKLVGPATYEMGTSESSFVNQLGAFQTPLGIIAGTSSMNPLWGWITPKPSDSIVMVESTKLDSMSDYIEVPYIHSFIMNKKVVQQYILHFLQFQKFQ
jgi:triacylglycerol lipase